MGVTKIKKVFDGVSVPAGTKVQSDPVPIAHVEAGVDGASLEAVVSGNGTAAFRVKMSNSGETFYVPSTANDVSSDILTGVDSTGGAYAAFTLPAGSRAEIEVEETSTTDDVTVTAWFGLQSGNAS